MNKVYNTQKDFTNELTNFLHICCPFLRKTQLNILPSIVYGMIQAESSVSSDISKHLKNEFSLVQPDSVIRRIRRFFSNKLFNGYQFYDGVIRHVIKNYKMKHSDKRVHIILDHMFSHDNYTVFMISMRIGKTGIPLWFRCFKDKDDTDAFQESLLIEGINYVHELFPKDYDLIFLADRWFNSTSLMQHIESLGHTYIFRLKKNIKVLIYDKKEGHKIWKWLDEIKTYKYHSVSYPDILLTNEKYQTNLVFSKRDQVDEAWILTTNGDGKRAIKDYGYRFGGIETLFKSQKSNGFYIESINNASLESFTNMYSLVCFTTLFLTILGADYSKNKNSRSFKNCKLTTHKNYKSGRKRVISLFNTGLTLIKTAFDSWRYIKISYTFILYDI